MEQSKNGVNLYISELSETTNFTDVLDQVRAIAISIDIQNTIDVSFSSKNLVALFLQGSTEQAALLRDAINDSLLAQDNPNIKVSIGRDGIQDYLINQLRVEGPDQSRYEFSNIPAFTPIKDIGAHIMNQYEDTWPKDKDSKPLNTQIDHINNEGSTTRMSTPDESLHEQGIEEGDTLQVNPETTAAGHGFVLFDYFKELEVGKSHSFIVSIPVRGELSNILRKYNKTYEARIRTTKVMSVEIIENSIDPMLQITPVSDIEQTVMRGDNNMWRFELTPKRAGITSILVKINTIKRLFWYGVKKKTIFIMDRQLNIAPGKNGRRHYDLIQTLENTLAWNDEVKMKLCNQLAENDLGSVISYLNEYAFYIDKEAHKQVVVLQSNWNKAKNNFNLGMTTIDNWSPVEARIVNGLLEVIEKIDDNNRVYLEGLTEMNKTLAENLKHQKN